MGNDFPQITKGKGLLIPHSEFQILRFPQTLQKHGGQQVHRLLSLFRLVKTIATWKTVIESMQSLGMDNFRVAYTRFLAFYSDSPCLLYTSPSPRDRTRSRMPSSA